MSRRRRIEYCVLIGLVCLSQGAGVLVAQKQDEPRVLDWSQGIYRVKVSSRDLGYSQELLKFYSQTISGREHISNQLLEKAQKLLLNAILNTRVDTLYFVKDYFHDDEAFRNQFVEYIQNTMIIFPTTYTSTHEIEKSIQYQIYGPRSLAAFLLQFNKELYDVESKPAQATKHKQHYSSLIIDLRHSFEKSAVVKEKLLIPPDTLHIPETLRHKLSYNKSTQELQFRGKMTVQEKHESIRLSPNNTDYVEHIKHLFLRSQKLQTQMYFIPSVFPRILDTDGHIIYSQNLIRMNQQTPHTFQYVSYLYNPLDIYKVELVGPNPVVVHSLHLQSEGKSTDIILSKEDIQRFYRTTRKIFLLLPSH